MKCALLEGNPSKIPNKESQTCIYIAFKQQIILVFYNILDVIRNQANLMAEYICFILHNCLICGVIQNEVLSFLNVSANKKKL
jgi:hypothetical protein